MPLSPPVIHQDAAQGQTALRLSGAWTVPVLQPRATVRRLTRTLRSVKPDQGRWDLSEVERIDLVGAQLLWEAWGQKLPGELNCSDEQRQLFKMLDDGIEPPPAAPRNDWLEPVRRLGAGMINLSRQLVDWLVLMGTVMLELLRFLARPTHGPWREISAQIFHTGAQALGITALVGFLIGVVLSYLSAQQLQLFGASVYIVNLLGVSVVRELGPVLAAILVAGRSGSSITAQIGVMRVTQELDALQVMGISHAQRLVLPRVIALAITMPLVIFWTDIMALLGGMMVAALTLDLSPHWFVTSLRDAISVTNLVIGLGKGVLFGVLIALVACHFGLRIEPNTESLGRGTTASVVSAITAVILADAVCAILFNSVGW